MEMAECLELLLRSSPRLATADFSGNPFCKGQVQMSGQRYRDAIILMSESLTQLDGEPITDQQRSFMLKLNIVKLKVRALGFLGLLPITWYCGRFSSHV